MALVHQTYNCAIKQNLVLGEGWQTTQ